MAQAPPTLSESHFCVSHTVVEAVEEYNSRTNERKRQT